MTGKKKRTHTKSTVVSAKETVCLSACRVKLEDITEIYTQAIPCRVGGDLSFIHLADDIGPPVLWNILKCAFSKSFSGRDG